MKQPQNNQVQTVEEILRTEQLTGSLNFHAAALKIVAALTIQKRTKNKKQ